MSQCVRVNILSGNMYHYSVFKDQGKWIAQVLEMPEEKVKMFRRCESQAEAQREIEAAKRRFGNTKPRDYNP